MPTKITTYKIDKRGSPLHLWRDSEHFRLDDLEMAGLQHCNQLLTSAHVFKSRKDTMSEFFSSNNGRLLYTLAEQGHVDALATMLGVLQALADDGREHSLLTEMHRCRDYELSHWRCGPLGGAAALGYVEVIDLLLGELARLDPTLAATTAELTAGAPKSDAYKQYEPAVQSHYAVVVAAQKGRQAVVDRLLEEYVAVDPSGALTIEALRPYKFSPATGNWDSEQSTSSVLADAVTSVSWFHHKEEGLAMVRRILDECWQVDSSGELTKVLLTQSHYGVHDVINRASIFGDEKGGHQLMQMLVHEYERFDPSGELLLRALRVHEHTVLFHVFQNRDLQTVSLLLDCYAKGGAEREAAAALEQFIANDDNLLVDELFVGKEMNQQHFYQDQRHDETVSEYEQRRDAIFKQRLQQLLASTGEEELEPGTKTNLENNGSIKYE